MTDPVTGQTVCSCQYDSAARLALGAYPRLTPTATTYSSYPTPTPSSTDQGPYPSIGMDSSAFYSPLVSPRVHEYPIQSIVEFIAAAAAAAAADQSRAEQR